MCTWRKIVWQAVGYKCEANTLIKNFQAIFKQAVNTVNFIHLVHATYVKWDNRYKDFCKPNGTDQYKVLGLNLYTGNSYGSCNAVLEKQLWKHNGPMVQVCICLNKLILWIK